jgi:CheY-like chemotaxis protein
LLEASRQMLKRALHERIDLRIIPASDLWTALVDPAQLENALLNLSINARDAMPDGGLLTIETANCTLDQEYADQNPGVLPGQYVRISLTDTGMGIPPEHIERIFEPFFTTKEVGKGTGLGLSMVYGFIKQSGGHIKVYSELEHGTCFKLYLPKAGDMAEAADLPSLDEEIQTGSGTVLVVEDEAMLREIARSHLASLGFTAILAGDSAEALQALELNPEIDLLFTDVMLPGTRNGRELAEEIRRIRPEIKVVFTSGYPENATNAVEPLGPSVHWLAKPYTKRELARILQSALTREDH